MDGFFSASFRLRPRRERNFWIGLWGQVSSQFAFQAGFEVTGLTLSRYAEDCREKSSFSRCKRLILLKAHAGFVQSTGNTTLSRVIRPICYMVMRSSRTSLRRRIRPSMKMEYLSLMHSTYQADEVFPGYSTMKMREYFAMLWDTDRRSLTPSCMSWIFFVKEADGSASPADEVHRSEPWGFDLWYLLEQAGFKSFKLYGLWGQGADRNQKHPLVFVAQK